MRKLSYIMAAVLLLSLSNLRAGETAKPKPAKSLSYQIKDLIGKDAIKVGDQDLKGKILFTLNKDREIVVLSVEADTKQMEYFLKSRLNYKKVDVGNWKEGKKYLVPVLVTS
jgi:hypothetical protein